MHTRLGRSDSCFIPNKSQNRDGHPDGASGIDVGSRPSRTDKIRNNHKRSGVVTKIDQVGEVGSNLVTKINVMDEVGSGLMAEAGVVDAV